MHFVIYKYNKKIFFQSMHVDLSNQLQPVLHLYAQR